MTDPFKDKCFVLEKYVCKGQVPLAESFYYVNYGSSIITSKVCQIISVMKNKSFSKIVHFGILNLFYLEDCRNTSVYVFITEIIWQTFDVIIHDP